MFVLFHVFLYFTSFTINSSVFTLQHKKSVPEPLYTLISSRLSISLHLGFALARLFHCLHHPCLSTMLLKAHHSISLHFCLALCFYTLLFVTNLVSHFRSHRTSSQASPHTSALFAFAILYTHTHTLSLSLSFSLRLLVIFVLASWLSLSHTVSHPRLHVTSSASCHTLGFMSRFQFCVTHSALHSS